MLRASRLGRRWNLDLIGFAKEDFKIAAELGDPEAIEIYKKYLEHKATHKLI